MTTSEGAIRLEWCNFQTNTTHQFRQLRTSQDFVDVTLVCEDHTSFEAHKVVLAAGSSFFERALGAEVKGNPHPLIFLRGIGSEEMTGLLDFIYTGQAMIGQNALQDFLAIAVSLGVKGLLAEAASQATPSQTNAFHNSATEDIKFNNIKKENFGKNMKEINSPDAIEEAKKIEITEDMILRGGGNFTCKVCDAEFTDETNVNDHVKMHLADWESSQEKRKTKRKRSKVWSFFTKNDSMTASCNVCGKDIKCKMGSTTNLHSHLQRRHGVEAESTGQSVEDK